MPTMTPFEYKQLKFVTVIFKENTTVSLGEINLWPVRLY